MNFSIRELESLRPRLRDGLSFSVQEQGGERVCVIEDTASSRFFRVGFGEYRFFRSLDGTQTVAAILARLARDGGGDSFTEHEALQMLRWLKDNHLLAVESDRVTSDAEHRQRAWQSAATMLNPLTVRVPLARPDRFFAWLATKMRPLLGWVGFLIWLGVMLAGAAHVAVDWQRFQHGFDGILASDNWLWLLLIWTGLKIFHECGHGIFCRHFGARVREVGLIFILLMPMGYVDATASLGFASRWRRIAVACAGVYVELFLAALAALWWSGTPDGPVATLLHNTIVMGSMVTLFFNVNPLMRFDGYYVMGDLLGIPNLATRGRGWFTRMSGWLLLGAKNMRPDRPHTRREWFVAGYGVAAWVWQLIVFAGILMGASVLLRGGGLVFAVLAGVMWIGVPLFGFARQMVDSLRGGAGRLPALGIRLALVLAFVAAVLFVPYHKTVVAPGVVEFGDTHVLRADCPGFVEKIHAHDGDVVAAGALLVELRNDEAAADFAKARRDLDAQSQRARLAYTRGDVASYQAEQARVESVRKTMRELETFLGTLQICAPIAGRVSSRLLAQKVGAFIGRGEEVLRVGEANGREVKLAVGQDAEPHFRAAGGGAVRVRVAGRGNTFDAKLERLDDNATRTLPHAALTALADGPLPVRRAEGEHGGYELAEPHFIATVKLGAASALADGELARVKFRSPVSVTLFSELRSAFARWAKKYGA